jgi:hypothetical protein
MSPDDTRQLVVDYGLADGTGASPGLSLQKPPESPIEDKHININRIMAHIGVSSFGSFHIG